MGVINIHVTGSFSIGNFDTTTLTNWWIENIFNSLTRWCVPVFFMVSGMFMLDSDKDEGLKLFFFKRTKKVLVPFMIWGIFYELIKTKYTGIPYSFDGMVKDFMGGTIYWHFWFLYVIIGLYILTPIVKHFVVRANKKLLLYTIGVWFIGVSILPLLENILNINFDPSTNFSVIGGYLGYFILGYFLNRYEISMWSKVIVYFGAILSLVSTAFLTYLVTLKNGGNLNAFFYDYLSITVVLPSTAIFIIIKSIKWDYLLKDREGLKTSIKLISHASFGIYLVHFVFINELALSSISIFHIQSNSLLRVPVMDLSVFILSFITVFILSRIPYIGKYIF
ncbi:acyltransferase [Paenibacillus thiaminolyticus]|uniref:acyltransferase n=1 Tax=Paenibacillus thiaminolyticus TaxID=49283 RepID=UPI0025431AC7|nr:acyltransferase family protein [Paenibacillus thiaminolyticus]WII37168.1 acyltransferase family protein [Paenibacillus thiaminolyticus]